MRHTANEHYVMSFFVTLILSISLIIGGFFCPPMGEIDGSVLTAIGILFLWPSLAFGNKALEAGKIVKIQKDDTLIEIGENNEVNEEMNDDLV